MTDRLGPACGSVSTPAAPAPSPFARLLARRGVGLALLVVAALLTRGQQLGNPIVHIDEQFYLLVGERMWSGAIPYVDIWDRKPIGLFLIYMAAAGIGPAPVLQYQLLAAASAIGTALTIERIATRFASPVAAWAAALLYLLYIPLLTGQGGQSPVFYNLLVALAALVLVRSSESPRPGAFRDGAAAMLAIGLAFQIKTSVVFEGAFLGLALLWLAARAGEAPAAIALKAVGWVGCALAPTIAAGAAYWAIGHFDAFWFANFVSIFRRGALSDSHGPRNAATLSLYLAPLLIAAAHGVRLRWSRPDVAARLVSVWFVVATVAVAMFGYWYDHYGLPVVAPAAASAASVFDRRRLRRWSVALLAGALVACLALPSFNQKRRGTPAQFRELVEVVRPHAAGGLLVWDNLPALYGVLDTPLPTRFPFPTHLREPNEIGAVGIDQPREVARILDARPAVIVIDRGKTVRGTSVTVFGRLARDYHRIATVRVGRRDQLVYLRNGSRMNGSNPNASAR